MKARTGVSFALASALTLVLACGDSKPAATPDKAGDGNLDAPQPPADSAASSTPPPAPGGAPGPVASASDSAADAGSPTPAASSTSGVHQDPSGVISVESKDECTPVGVDFEKRARPKVKECYAQGKKTTKNPDLQGAVKIKVVVDMKGKIKSTTIIEKSLPDSVAQCMLAAVKGTPFPEVDKCWDSTITIPIQFPTPR